MDESKQFNFFYKMEHNLYKVYNQYKELQSMMTYNELNKLKHRYELFKGYDVDHGEELCLVVFAGQFKKWNEQMYIYRLQHPEIQKYISTFSFSYTNDLAVIRCVKAYLNSNGFNIESDNGPKFIESIYFEGCNNGMLTFCIPGTYFCYGKDAICCYPRLLGASNLQIPIKEGKEIKITELPEKLQFGFYRVRIVCSHPKFLFNYSIDHIYTHYSLDFARKHQETYGITIQLITDIEYNAYIYNDGDLIYTRDLFGQWFTDLLDMKTALPGNKLVKHLLSSVWGILSTKTRINVKKEDLGEYNYGSAKQNREYIWKDQSNNKKNDYYILVPRDKPYKYNIRLKPFLLSYARTVISDVAYKNHFNEVVRIFCDNIVYQSDVPFNEPNFANEAKTSGLISFKNAHVYTKLEQ